MAAPLRNGNKLLEITIDVHIMRKKDEIRQEKEDILRTITAISNYQRRGVIRMNNLQRFGRTKKSGLCEKVTAKHLDQWKKIINQEALKLLPGDWNIFEFCSRSQDEEYLYCHVTPSIRPITIEYNLHVLSAAADVTRVRNFEDALAILIRNKSSESQIQPTISQQIDLESNAAHPNFSYSLYQELKTTPNAHQIYQKYIGIVRDKSKSRDASVEREEMTQILKVLSNHISALANSSGGIINVTDDSNIFTLAEEKVSKNDQDLITQCLEKCIQNKIWGRKKVAPTRMTNWNVQFPVVRGEKIIFTLHVLAFYGGVFEDEPVAFTIEKDTSGTFEVVRMNFQDWFKAMMRRHLETEEAKQEAATKLRDIEERGSNQVCISNKMTSF